MPTAPVAVAVALADKLDTLVGFFAIDEKPTGSRDPFALRRAALGVIRIMLDATSWQLGCRASRDLTRSHGSPWPCEPRALRRGRPIGWTPRLLRRPAEGAAARRRASATTSSTPSSRSATTTSCAIVARVEALDGFLATEDGANLLAGYKRAVNILKAEEKKGAAADRRARRAGRRAAGGGRR